MSGKKRGNSEGSIYDRGTDKKGRELGWAGYVWVTRPDGTRQRKYVYGPDRPTVHEKWIKLHAKAAAGTVVTKGHTVAAYLSYWLENIVEPHRAPGTFDNYERFCRLYLIPGLGSKQLNKLRSRELQTWFNKVARTCQCCAQGKDERRIKAERRCCAKSPRECCKELPSADSLNGIRTTLRAAWNHAHRTEEVDGSNPVDGVELVAPRRGRHAWWSSEEASSFLQRAREQDPNLYAAYVLILVLGLRRGEVLGLTWKAVDLKAGELTVERQLQRIRGELLLRPTKTPASMATLPLPDICVAALMEQQRRQKILAARAGEAWQENGLVFTTSYGMPVEPRNFNRSFHAQCKRSDTRRIKVHDARRTCASLLADLDVHPRRAMQILRHAKFSMTMEVYTEVSSKATREALDKLGQLLE